MRPSPSEGTHSGSGLLPPGRVAPVFSLPVTPDSELSLLELRGRPVVLAFYTADFHPVCTEQLTLFSELLPEFSALEALVLGISVDGIWSHLAFARERQIRFPLLSDFAPRGAVARQYGAFSEAHDLCERALFVLDGEGMVRWTQRSPAGVNPGVEGVLAAMELLDAERGSRSFGLEPQSGLSS